MKATAFLLAILVLAAGCTAKPTNTLQECESKQTIAERDNCYKEKAFESNALGLCTQIIEAEKRNECINAIS